MNAVCPPKPRLMQLLSGGLAPHEESAVEDHVEHCADCQQYLVGLTADVDLSKQLAAANAAAPEIPESLRRRAERVCEADGNTIGQGEPTGGKSGPLVGDPPSLPGYDVQEMLGQGGLAIVYRAIHRQLRRAVAIKVLRQQPSADERERLRREAGALAGLRHPNVVQIYEAGEVDGRPFLVLEYVAGGSLARYQAGRPMPSREAAGLVAAIASAMDAAHKNGLIHRDLKPANILLEWEGGQAGDDLGRCRAKVTDFGLVKDVAGDSDLTHKRDLIGTPAYMAPEQAAGAADTGPAADIWALGAILYELLTGRPPFHGVSALDTLFQVRFAEPVSPKRLQPRVPRDLETICLKCLQKTPANRYASAQDLADDLNRFLAGKPVEARRTPMPVRAWGWCKRNQPLAILGAVAASMLMMLAIGGPIVALHQTRLRNEAADRAAQAETERQRAGQNLELATQALDETIRQVYASFNIRPESIPDLDHNVTGVTVPYLEKLVSQDAVTPEQHLQRSRAKRQLARALPVPRDVDRCASLFTQSKSEIAALVAQNPERREFQRELALCHFEFGRFFMSAASRFAAGEAELKRAIEIQGALVKADPKDAQASEELGNSLSNIGEQLARTTSRKADAKPYLERALELRQQLRLDNPKSTAFAMNESFTRLWLGRVLASEGDFSAAIEVMREGIQVQRGVVASKPDDPQIMFILAHHEQHLGFSLANADRWDEAVPYLDISAQRYDRLAAAFPAAPKFNQAAITCHDSYARLLALHQAWPAAIQQTSDSLAVIERYCAEYPRNNLARTESVAARCRLAQMQLRGGQVNEAIASSRRARVSADAIDFPRKNDECRGVMADAFVDLADAMISVAAADSLDLCDRSLAALGEIKMDTPHCEGFLKVKNKAQAVRVKALAALGNNQTRGNDDHPLEQKRDH